jgi:hypothetical protein
VRHLHSYSERVDRRTRAQARRAPSLYERGALSATLKMKMKETWKSDHHTHLACLPTIDSNSRIEQERDLAPVLATLINLPLRSPDLRVATSLLTTIAVR